MDRHLAKWYLGAAVLFWGSTLLSMVVDYVAETWWVADPRPMWWAYCFLPFWAAEFAAAYAFMMAIARSAANRKTIWGAALVALAGLVIAAANFACYVLLVLWFAIGVMGQP
jgi:hypothetical protein